MQTMTWEAPRCRCRSCQEPASWLQAAGQSPTTLLAQHNPHAWQCASTFLTIWIPKSSFLLPMTGCGSGGAHSSENRWRLRTLQPRGGAGRLGNGVGRRASTREQAAGGRRLGLGREQGRPVRPPATIAIITIAIVTIAIITIAIIAIAIVTIGVQPPASGLAKASR